MSSSENDNKPQGEDLRSLDELILTRRKMRLAGLVKSGDTVVFVVRRHAPSTRVWILDVFQFHVNSGGEPVFESIGEDLGALMTIHPYDPKARGFRVKAGEVEHAAEELGMCMQVTIQVAFLKWRVL